MFVFNRRIVIIKGYIYHFTKKPSILNKKKFTMNNLLYTCCFIFLLTNSYGFAQPSNNNLCDTILLTVNPLDSMPNCDGLHPYNNFGAAFQSGEPTGICWDSPVFSSVWFAFEAPAIGAVSISTNFPGGILEDTEIALYGGTPCPGNDFTALTQIECSGDFGSSLLSEIPTALLIPGDIYYIQVHGFDGDMGTFCLEVTETVPCNNNSSCDMGENICSCADCSALCNSTNLQAQFLDYNPIADSPNPVVYCESAISGTPNPSPSAVYIPIKPTSLNIADFECVTWALSTTEGSFYSSADTIGRISTIAHDSIFFLKITDEDNISTVGMTQITFTALGTVDPCAFTFDINWNDMILQDDGTEWAGSAAMQCCSPPTAMAIYNCETSELIVDVTDAGSPTMGMDFIIAPNIGMTQTIVDTGMYIFPAMDQDTTYSILISDGDSACDLSIDEIIPDCIDPCPDTLYVMGGIMDSFYQARHVLISNDSIPPMKNVIFQAGFEIDLLPEFKVSIDTDFEAKIDSCDMLRLSQDKK